MSDPQFHRICNAPTPVAPFSHAVESDGWAFLTGQMPTDSDDDSKPLPDGENLDRRHRTRPRRARGNRHGATRLISL